ncbi:M48 family metalloprotease [Streptomyces sp. Ag109_G2-15]|uniref:M48 family metalloprotease n=1 Tax=Streptomyces sp. Ag109_G2-15 TaxID=1938850 RepID=UPI000BD24835|nr:M48 family metalloprotease [Streptomyces sp. Ag109_G2-15]SOD89242.1 Zn-dependent protease with chaperone function [Streptomyces sp. Ag109_G2-15]
MSTNREAFTGRRAGQRASPGLPGGTTSRFVLLIAAVGAGGLYVFLQAYFLVPQNADYFFGTFSRCFQDPRISLPDQTNQGYEESRRLLSACEQPAFVDQAQWIGIGFLLLCAVSSACYLSHPWWVTRSRCERFPALPSLRSRTLSRFPSKDKPEEREMAEYLADLCRAVGVQPEPVWLLDAWAASKNGLTFGLPWRRCVIVDDGLAKCFHADRDLFRAVMVHELAHLRNRDVDKTYLAFGIGWAFLIVAVMPFGALALHSAWSGGPPVLPSGALQYLVDAPHALGLAAALTLLVRLVRNSVLRARELHADATAAAQVGYEGAAAIPRGLPDRPTSGQGSARAAFARLTRRLGYWPTPETRQRVLREPALLTRPTVWEMLAAGVVAGVFTASADDLVDTLFRLLLGKLNTLAGNLTVGCAIGAGLAGVLAAAVWRTVAASDLEPRSPRAAWPALPTGLVGGYLAGASLPLITDGTELPATTIEVQGFAWLPRTGPVLLAGALCVTVWLISAARGLLPRARGRRALYAVVATSVVSFAPWFAVWYSLRRVDASNAFQPVLGDAPDIGSSIGWYTVLGRWTGFTWTPLTVQGQLPSALVGLMLLWLVPLGFLLSSGRVSGTDAEARPQIGTALLVGLAGGISVVAAGTALPFLARTALPPAVLHYSGTQQDTGFPAVYWHTYIALACVAQGAVAMVLSATVRRHRPALVLAAVSLTAPAAALGRAPAFAVVGCTRLFGASARHCSVPFDPEVLAGDLRIITLRGLLAVIPAALLGAAAGALARSRIPALRDTRPAGEYRKPARTHVWALATALVVLVAADVASVALALPADQYAWEIWLRG